MSTFTKKPRVSVVIPTYNCDRYIVEAVKSVIAQDRVEWELLIVDDGSTDNTREVLQPYGDRLQYIYQKNQGVAAARNLGIRMARGEFIAFLDADDYFFPDKLAAQVAIFDEKPNLGLVHSGWQRVNSEGKPLLNVTPWEKIPDLNLETWLRWKPVLPSAMMFRREWLEYVGGFDPRFPPAEDTDLALRLALKGCLGTWLPKITVGYRQHEQSAMHKGLPQARSLTAVMDNFFAQPNLPEKVRLIENKIRHGTFVWIAWYLYHTGHLDEMLEYLQRSWQHTPYLPIETIAHWVESFAEFSRNWGTTFDADALAKLPQWQDLIKWVFNQNKVEKVEV
ncbi:MAG: glycosyltransferase [Xenococcaceae cyanobacterium]